MEKRLYKSFNSQIDKKLSKKKEKENETFYNA